MHVQAKQAKARLTGNFIDLTSMDDKKVRGGCAV
jgi:hypothetical protein